MMSTINLVCVVIPNRCTGVFVLSKVYALLQAVTWLMPES